MKDNLDSSVLDDILTESFNDSYDGIINDEALEYAKTLILSRYRSVDDIKKAVGEMETNGQRLIGVPAGQRDQLRKEILAALKIGDET